MASRRGKPQARAEVRVPPAVADMLPSDGENAASSIYAFPRGSDSGPAGESHGRKRFVGISSSFCCNQSLDKASRSENFPGPDNREEGTTSSRGCGSSTHSSRTGYSHPRISSSQWDRSSSDQHSTNGPRRASGVASNCQYTRKETGSRWNNCSSDSLGSRYAYVSFLSA